MTLPDWDDERLDAAFLDRFDRPAPAGLENDVHVCIAETTPARFGGWRIRRAWSLAAAAVVVVLVAGVAMIGLGGLGRTGGSPIPSYAGVTASAAAPTPTEQALPGLVFDLPIMHLSDAMAIRDVGIDDREIAVLGWFSDGGPVPCPAPVPNLVNPLQAWCPDEFVWLMERPETLISHSGNGTTIASPSGPALNPDLDGVDRSWEPPGGGVLDANGLSVPIDVVFVGHFDDRRASLCPEADVAACRDRFVVDAVARVHGVEPPLSVLRQNAGNAVSTVDDIQAIVGNEVPQSPILSMTVVDGTTGLERIEPSSASVIGGRFLQPVLWVVRVLETDRIATYIVRDGSDTIYKMKPGYALDCASLAPDTCEKRAAAIVAENLKASPPKRVVAIRFSDDPCGSFSVDFDDGTSAVTTIDCFISPSPS